MKNNWKNIDEAYHKSLKDFKFKPSDSVWQNLEKKLVVQNTPGNKSNSRRKGLLFFLLFCVLALLGGIGYQELQIVQKPSAQSLLIDNQNPKIESNKNAGLTIISSESERPQKELVEKIVEKVVQSKKTMVLESEEKLDHQGELKLTVVGKQGTPSLSSDGSIQSHLDSLNEIEQIDFPLNLPLKSEESLGKPVATLSKKRKICVRPWVAFQSSFRKLKENPDIDGMPTETLNFFNQAESNIASINYGFYVDYPLNEFWTLTSGVGISNFGVASKYPTKILYTEATPIEFLTFSSLSNNTVSIESSEIKSQIPSVEGGDLIDITVFSDLRLQYLSLPLLIGWHKTVGRFKWQLQGGVEAHFYVGQSFSMSSSELILNNINTPEIEEPRLALWGYKVESAFSYYLNGSTCLSLAPYYQGVFNTINPDKAVLAKPYSYGARIGVGFNF